MDAADFVSDEYDPTLSRAATDPSPPDQVDGMTRWDSMAVGDTVQSSHGQSPPLESHLRVPSQDTWRSFPENEERESQDFQRAVEMSLRDFSMFDISFCRLLPVTRI